MLEMTMLVSCHGSPPPIWISFMPKNIGWPPKYAQPDSAETLVRVERLEKSMPNVLPVKGKSWLGFPARTCFFNSILRFTKWRICAGDKSRSVMKCWTLSNEVLCTDRFHWCRGVISFWEQILFIYFETCAMVGRSNARIVRNDVQAGWAPEYWCAGRTTAFTTKFQFFILQNGNLSNSVALNCRSLLCSLDCHTNSFVISRLKCC